MPDLQRCSCSCGCAIPLTTTDARKSNLAIIYKLCFMCDNGLHDGTNQRKAIVEAQSEVDSWKEKT
jgi:hypothetical protein